MRNNILTKHNTKEDKSERLPPIEGTYKDFVERSTAILIYNI